MKLRKGDKIVVIAGKDKGREGEIDRVYSKQGTVLIPGINIYKRHVRKSEQVPEGGVVEMPRAIRTEKVAYVCPACKKQTRIGYILEGEKKFRVCRKCNERIK